MIHIKESLLAAGITLPDKVREITFADTLKIQMMDAKKQVKSQVHEMKVQIKEQAEVNLEEKRNRPEDVEDTQDKYLVRLADTNPLLTERTKNNLLKP